MKRVLTALAATLPFAANAADAISGAVQRQPTNWQAIVMFLIFVIFTLGITYWASKRVRSRNDYYTAGGNITGFQNGLAIAGDYMSAASFLGISALVFTSGYDGLIYSLGFLVGWPIILFLIAERLRNLGRYTFADVASYRLKQGPIRILSACGSLVVVALYLIAQMVGAGKLIELLFGLNYHIAVVLVGVLMMMYVLFGGMLATTWVQIIKAVRRQLYGLHGNEARRLQLQQPVHRSDGSTPKRPRDYEPGRSGKRSDIRPVVRSWIDVRYSRFAAYSDAFLHGQRCPRSA